MENQKYNVESFNLDHTKVTAPYVRQASKKVGAKVGIKLIPTFSPTKNAKKLEENEQQPNFNKKAAITFT